MRLAVLMSLLAAGWVAGCALPPAATAPPVGATPATPASPAASLPRFRCEHDIEFTVRYADDTAVIDAGPRGREVLLRDAGGLTPQQSVFSNPRLRAEFGLGAGGKEAVLRYLAPAPLVAQCKQD